jgi:hypothetical protein
MGFPIDSLRLTPEQNGIDLNHHRSPSIAGGSLQDLPLYALSYQHQQAERNVLNTESINPRKGGGGKSGGLPTEFFCVSKNLGDAGHRFLA